MTESTNCRGKSGPGGSLPEEPATLLRTVIAVVLVLASVSMSAAESKFDRDLGAVQVYRDGLRGIVAFAASRRDLFPAVKPKGKRVLTREQKEAVWAAWQSFLDYLLALDSIRDAHHGFLQLSGEQRANSFLAYYGAFLAQYRYAIEFFMVAGKDSGLDLLLNEPVPEIGLKENTGALLKQRFLLNPGKGGGWALLEGFYRALHIVEWPEIRSRIEDDSRFIREIAKGKGEALAVIGAAEMAKKFTFSAIFPVQSGVSEFMGDTKVYRPSRSLVSQKQISDLIPKLEPGDILLERREWYLSNIGLPGFWPHAALYVGTPGQRAAYFNDPGVKQWVQEQGQASGSFEILLELRNPGAYRASAELYMGHAPRVLEAMSEGVTFTSIEHSAEADSVAVLRPKLPKIEKAQAILRAFHYAGRPYDFNFDFRTDASLVCTELIFKAYEPARGFHGLTFPLVEIAGRVATPANILVRQFDEQYGTPAQQTDFILFLDGYEKQKRALESTLAAFRQSWKRPKWHVLTQ